MQRLVFLILVMYGLMFWGEAAVASAAGVYADLVEARQSVQSEAIE